MDGLQLHTKLLKNIPIFRSLSDDLLQGILNAPENGIEEYEPKHLIIRESEIGDCMYIILEGAVEVLIRAESSNREISIATLRAGDFFGERSLMPGSTGRRNATIKSVYPTKVFRIDKKYVLLSIKRDDFSLSDDEDVTAINITTSKPAAPQKTPAPSKPAMPAFPPDEVRDLIMKIRLFKSLNRDELLSIHEWTEVVKVGPGDFVLKESQPGDAMFVVLDGTVEIFTLDSDGKVVVVANLKTGDYFGEQALMPDSKGKRNAFARSEKESRLIKIPKEYFRLVLNRDSELAKELKKKHEEQKQKLKDVRQ
jgi:CRP-like cAMP-binding protein